MNRLPDMIWIEMRKAIRSRMPLWTALGSLFPPLGIGFLIFVARNPQISQQLGLISAKADLMAYAATDWSGYLTFVGEIIAAAGIFLFGLVISWVFGREFSDGTVQDILAVPVDRASILLAKFVVMAVWSVLLTLVILTAGLVMGALMGLPAGSASVIVHGSLVMLACAGLTIVVTLPFAFLASVGRGYLLPLGGVILAIMAANIVALIGWGEYFPWGVPGLFVMGSTPLVAASYWIVAITGLAGMAATWRWWQTADQNR